jgi:ABC-type multidrug transport system, ATPase component
MLEVKALKKSYGSLVAIDGISLCAAAGENVGLLGPNGAGKTTTVSIIAGLLRPDSGEVLIDGRALGGDTDPVKRKIGLAPQDIALYDELPAYDNLTFFGALYDLDGAAAKHAIAEALESARHTSQLARRRALALCGHPHGPEQNAPGRSIGYRDRTAVAVEGDTSHVSGRCNE